MIWLLFTIFWDQNIETCLHYIVFLDEENVNDGNVCSDEIDDLVCDIPSSHQTSNPFSDDLSPSSPESPTACNTINPRLCSTSLVTTASPAD